MLRPDEGPIRAAAYLTVIVPPKTVHFTNYQSGTIVDVNEEIPLNLTCEAPNAKPEAVITWRIDHKKVLTCEAAHEDSGIQIRTNLTLNVLFTQLALMYSFETMFPFRQSPRKNEAESWHFMASTAAASWLLEKPRYDIGPPPGTTATAAPDGAGYLPRLVHRCEYNRTASCMIGKTNEGNATIDPPDRPRVSMLNGDSFVRAGDNVTLACVVTGGNPPPDVSWYLKDRLLDARFHYDIQTQVEADCF
ncbi:hypothetical protein TELCIR_03464 [Teladorsagia circumcincta]|uniref:Ig-like domain-containing protein n=1 Tax=Teladorsagia circumcincta TaxID=45464 RepID=A0A2G9UWB2_TELCI|nr:hypothetical protein TELCIR_03464 [Teladorsagia circumcincta]